MAQSKHSAAAQAANLQAAANESDLCQDAFDAFSSANFKQCKE